MNEYKILEDSGFVHGFFLLLQSGYRDSHAELIALDTLSLPCWCLIVVNPFKGLVTGTGLNLSEYQFMR